MQWARALALVTLTLVATSCRVFGEPFKPAAARELDLTNSVWSVTEVRSLPVSEPATIVFPDLDNVTLSTACGADSTSVAIDADGSAISFDEFEGASSPCSPQATAARDQVLAAIAGVTEWQVESPEAILLLGPGEQPRLRLGRSSTEWR